jgi:hypothetical protein
LQAERLLACQIGKGQFATEYSVRFRNYENVMLSMFVDREFVTHGCYHVTHIPQCKGWCKVKVLDERDGLSMVELPSETFEMGRVVTVRNTQLV